MYREVDRYRDVSSLVDWIIYVKTVEHENKRPPLSLFSSPTLGMGYVLTYIDFMLL